jgi:hypothetical protein
MVFIQLILKEKVKEILLNLYYIFFLNAVSFPVSFQIYSNEINSFFVPKCSFLLNGINLYFSAGVAMIDKVLYSLPI